MNPDDCGQCGHDFDVHAMVMTGDVPFHGGIVLCPKRDCDCYNTWAPGGVAVETVTIPAQLEIQRIRALLQGDR